MYVCMYVRMYVCTYVRMYVCMYVCIYVHPFTIIHPFTIFSYSIVNDYTDTILHEDETYDKERLIIIKRANHMKVLIVCSKKELFIINY